MKVNANIVADVECDEVVDAASLDDWEYILSKATDYLVKEEYVRRFGEPTPPDPEPEPEPTPEPEPEPEPEPTPDPVPQPSGSLLISYDQIMQLPTSGKSWDYLVSVAEKNSTANISDQDNSHNIETLAKALVGIRLGDSETREDARHGIMSAIGTERGGRTLALGRNLAAYVIAADIVGLSSTDNSTFKEWLRETLTETLDGKTLVSTHEERPNNWGTHAGASRAAVAAYLEESGELARTSTVFSGWLGFRDIYAGFKYGDLSWQADPSRPVGVNPSGSMNDGHSIDGALPDDMRRGGSFHWPPSGTGYPWEALQGAVLQAEILFQHGYDAWSWQDQAIMRAVVFLYSIGWAAEGDDRWIPWLVEARYPTLSLVPERPAQYGKNFGFTDWLYGSA